jgi:hypothetical protein
VTSADGADGMSKHWSFTIVPGDGMLVGIGVFVSTGAGGRVIVGKGALVGEKMVQAVKLIIVIPLNNHNTVFFLSITLAPVLNFHPQTLMFRTRHIIA